MERLFIAVILAGLGLAIFVGTMFPLDRVATLSMSAFGATWFLLRGGIALRPTFYILVAPLGCAAILPAK